MRYSNLHTHTSFSDGLHTVEENILSAIEKNMVSLGISDHSYTSFDLRYCMRPVNIPAYIREVRRLQQKYADKIEIYLGLEYDGYTKLENRELYDYVIGDCHYIKIGNDYFSVDHKKEEQKEVMVKYFGDDSLAYAKAYYDTYVSRIKEIKPDVLGHFDLLTKYNQIDEHSDAYKKLATDALIACLETTPVIELNTGAICKKLRTEPYPVSMLLKETVNHGGKILLSSDSHDKANLTFHFDESVQLLKSIGCKSIVMLKGGRFEEVGL